MLLSHSQYIIHARPFFYDYPVYQTDVCGLQNSNAGCRRGSLRAYLTAKKKKKSLKLCLPIIFIVPHGCHCLSKPSGSIERICNMAFRSVLANKSVAKVKTHHRKSKSIDLVSSPTSAC